MINYIVRAIKRLVVLLPGLIVAYFVAKDVYPILDREIPAPLAVLFAYILVAYIVIPTLLRVLKFLIRPKHIPLYCITSDGFASDPINIGIYGTRQQVIKAMRTIGWYKADKRSVKTIFKYGLATLFKEPYPTAPFSNLYLFGRKQDFGFELPSDHSLHGRHHVRFWACAPTLSSTQQEHLDFWQKHLPGKRVQESQLWVGAASLDIGLGIIAHNAQFTHSVHPDTDSERDLIVAQLKNHKLATSTKTIMIGKAYKLRNRVFRSHLKSDGKMKIVTLKDKV
jgi:hypothetical protein